MNINNNKTIPLISLRAGHSFTIPTLEDSMRNMVVIRAGDCSVKISGEKKKSQEDPWEHFEDNISPYTQVICTGEVTLIKGKDGTIKIDKKSLHNNTKHNNIKANTNSNNNDIIMDGLEENTSNGSEISSNGDELVTKTKRTRKTVAKTPLTFPQGEFSLDEVAELNKVPKYQVNNYLTRNAKAGKVLLQQVGERRKTTKGKATKVYRTV